METQEKGHTDLIADLEEILNEANEFQFHDFKNTKYPFPKNALMDKVHALKVNILSGKYDN